MADVKLTLSQGVPTPIPIPAGAGTLMLKSSSAAIKLVINQQATEMSSGDSVPMQRDENEVYALLETAGPVAVVFWVGRGNYLRQI